ncbi:MAG: GNAT family N-acetyltransferase [Steroidobacteraceae bacterium]
MDSRVLAGLDGIAANAWDALAPAGAPFTSHAFLAGLERTGCVGGETGWHSAHVILEDAQGIAAAAPTYLKSNSYGEFVFDFAWAQAYARAGLEYYPKLAVTIPYTPVTGPRLLVRPDLDRAGVARRLIAALEALAAERDASSVHVLFPGEADAASLDAAGWLGRRDCQFHWVNRGYESFEHYLAGFTAAKRKKVKRERRRVAESGIRFETWDGGKLDERRLDAVYALHRDTFLRHGREPYLTREFFTHAARHLGASLLVKAALWRGALAACAVFFRSTDTLYGRYWGAAADFHSLHFETCYHQGIEYCIESGLARFEPGTQGEHKVARGFEPALTRSAHYIADSRFRHAIAGYLAQEGRSVDAYAEAVRAHVPFRAAHRETRE